jgi:hypothetical protein
MVATAALALSMLSSSCSDQPTQETKKVNNPFALIANGGSEISFNNLDGTEVYGLAKVYRGQLHDDGTYADQTLTSLWAAFGTDAGPDHLQYCRAGGIDVPEDGSSTIRMDFNQHATITPGADVRWETEFSDNVTFDGSVQLPLVPTITNIAPYQTISSAGDMRITTANSVTGGEAVVTIYYDPQRTADKGLSDPPVSIDDVPEPVTTYMDTQEDDGNLTVPATELGNLVKGKVYMLTVQRFRYVVRPTSRDDRSVGLGAISEYTTPIIIR